MTRICLLHKTPLIKVGTYQWGCDKQIKTKRGKHKACPHTEYQEVPIR